MESTRLGQSRRFAPGRLLIVAGAALAVVFVGVWGYPHLVEAGVRPTVLTGLRAVVLTSTVAVFVLPIAAIVRRLTR